MDKFMDGVVVVSVTIFVLFMAAVLFMLARDLWRF